MDVVVYALLRKFISDSLIGLGALKGANCKIQSIVDNVDGTHDLTFLWKDDNNVNHTSVMTVANGETPGIEVTPITGGHRITFTTTNPPQTQSVDIMDGVGGSGSLENELKATVNVGGIKSGKVYPQGTKFEKMFKDLISPVMYPTLTAPSAVLTATGAKLLEAGSTLDTTFTVTFDRGSINPAYGTSGYRSGAPTSYTLDGETKGTNTFTRTITPAKTSYQASVAYAAGEQPKDSEGNNYNTPLAAGSVTSEAVEYEFVDALWANVGDITRVTKQALVSITAKQKDFSFPAQTKTNPEVFDVPASWTVKAVQVKNDLSGAYENALDQFTVTNVTHNDASGASVAYKRYTCNLGYATGARSVRLKWI